MATPVENLTSILTGALGQAPTPIQLNTIADAALSKVTDEEIAATFSGITKVNLSNNQRALIANTIILKLLRRLIRTYKVSSAQTANRPAIEAAANDNTL